jgi:hypothetical protein
MTFLVVLGVIVLAALALYGVFAWIVEAAFARGEHWLQERQPEDFRYADAGRMHRETQGEVDRLAARLPAQKYPAPVAGPTAKARGPYRSGASTGRVGDPRELDRNSDYGQSTSLVSVEGDR